MISQLCMILTKGDIPEMTQGARLWHLLLSLPLSRSISEMSLPRGTARAHREGLRRKALAD